MSEDKNITIKELFDDLPMSIRQLAQEIKVNEVTLARIRDGKPTRRPMANKLLMFFSNLYEQKYTLRNVTGINIMEYKRKGDGQADEKEDTKEDDSEGDKAKNVA